MDFSFRSKDAVEKRKTLVAPWKNREEFVSVYQLLYGESATNETKLKACRKMMVWKARRLNFTPASVLATLVIVEMQLKDSRKIDDKEAAYDMQVMYSGALTRFLNYMSSVVQTGNMKSMYDTAKDLGLDTFLVDLRHICAHGQNLPSLEIFRQSSAYCMTWLKEYFWENELTNYKDCDARFIRQQVSTYFDDTVTKLFEIYDVALEAVLRDANQMVVVKNRLTTPKYELLHQFSQEREEDSVPVLLELVVKQLSSEVKKEPGLKDLPEIFIEALLKMKYFFEFPAEIGSDKQIKMAIDCNRQLFRTIAMYGFIEDLFYKLVGICENQFEEVYRRKGASFWANHIVIGFVAFKKFKSSYKAEKDEDPSIQYDLRTINTEIMAKDVQNIYSKLKVDIEMTLIFGDTFRRPWFLSFDHSYIEKRVACVNELTTEILKNSLHLVEPPLPEEKLSALESLIDIYLELHANGNQNQSRTTDNGSKIYTLNDLLPSKETADVEMTEIDSNKKIEKFGIWSVDCDGQEWQSCPLGKLIWE